MAPIVRQLVEESVTALGGKADVAWLESRILLGHILQKDHAWLIAHGDHEVEPRLTQAFYRLVERRKQGHPVAHLTGKREFWSLELTVTPDTLIPRPETELLVELVLGLPLDPPSPAVLDFGTGSGAIAIALARERPDWKIHAIDRSHLALEIARLNADRNGVNQVMFVAGDRLDAGPLKSRKYDVIVSNPPYIRDSDPHLDRGDVRFEPRQALVSGKDGLDCIRHLIMHAPDHLAGGGYLLLEHGYDQAAAVRALFRQHGYANIETRRDINGNDRVTMAVSASRG